MCVGGKSVDGRVGVVDAGVVADPVVGSSVLGDDRPDRTAALPLLVFLELIVHSLFFFSVSRLGMIAPVLRKVLPVWSIIFSILLSSSSSSVSSPSMPSS